MSPLTVSRSEHEHTIQRPTSDDVIYDVRQEHLDYKLSLHENFRTPLADTVNKLYEISKWQENWDGRGAAKPKFSSILAALRWIMGMRAQVPLTRCPWVEPHVVADTNGNMVFEWSKMGRTLSIYVSAEAAEYLKVEGPNIFEDMEDGEITTPEVAQDLWRWLMGQE